MTYFKAIFISCLILGISFLHLTTDPSKYGLHILHSQLFFIPIILASFWFGLRLGLTAAVLICFIYTPLVVSNDTHTHGTLYPVLFTQLAMYLFVSVLIGWLRDRQQAQQERLLAGERTTALVNAASALSFEIKDVVNGLDSIHRRSSGLKVSEEEQHFQQELNRLNRLVKVLSQFVPEEEQTTISADLNQLLESTYTKCIQQAKKAGVELILQADPAGCPSMIAGESLGRVLDSLVDNAIEASEHGKKVYLRSTRGGDSCLIDIIDEGKGVTALDREKLFTPFFTTKPHGNGLALAAGRKVLRDHGGELVYLPGEPEGTTFRMIVPRENVQHNIDEFVREQQLGAAK
jgi:signal transduction histidine kinase